MDHTHLHLNQIWPIKNLYIYISNSIKNHSLDNKNKPEKKKKKKKKVLTRRWDGANEKEEYQNQGHTQWSLINKQKWVHFQNPI